MLTLGPHTRVFVAREPLDMRGSFDAVTGRVRRLGLDPVNGHLYLFFSRRRTMLVILWFDGSGWCLLRKRLCKGTFELPAIPDGASQLPVDGRALRALLDGVALDAPRRHWLDRSPVAQS